LLAAVSAVSAYILTSGRDTDKGVERGKLRGRGWDSIAVAFLLEVNLLVASLI
jgi:hypothetical protein